MDKKDSWNDAWEKSRGYAQFDDEKKLEPSAPDTEVCCANCGKVILASAGPLCLDCAMLKMASDPDIQREMKAIRDEEAVPPADGKPANGDGWAVAKRWRGVVKE